MKKYYSSNKSYNSNIALATYEGKNIINHYLIKV